MPGIIRVFIDERGNNSLGNFVNWIKVKIFVDSVHCNLKVLFKIQCFQDWVLEMQILYQKVSVLLMENFLSNHRKTSCKDIKNKWHFLYDHLINKYLNPLSFYCILEKWKSGTIYPLLIGWRIECKLFWPFSIIIIHEDNCSLSTFTYSFRPSSNDGIHLSINPSRLSW